MPMPEGKRAKAPHAETLWCVVRDDGVNTWFVLLSFGWWRWHAIEAFLREGRNQMERKALEEAWKKARRAEPGLRVVKVRAEEVVRGRVR